jgi:hypothetical protein
MNEPIHEWDCGWDEHKLRQLQRMARMPLVKKIEWLEQAHHVVIALTKSRAAREQAKRDENNQSPTGT